MTVPTQLVLKGGDGAFGQGNGAGDRCKQHQREKQDAHHGAKAHAFEHLGDGNKHQGRASLQGIGVAAGEREDRRNDHQARHDGNGRVKNFDVLGGLLNRDVLFHIGAERDQNAHGDGQGIEHLPHGRDDGHPGEMGDIGHEEILHTRQRPGPGDGVSRNDDGKHHQNGHHDFGDPFHAVADARKDDRQREDGEDDKADLRRSTIGDERREIAVRGQLLAVPGNVFRQIPDDPAANDRVIGHDEDGDDGVDPAAEREPALFAKGRESAHRALLGHPAQSRLRHDHGIAERERQQNVDEQKDAAAILGRQIRETPDVAKANGRACGRQHKADLAGERAPLFVLRFHVFLLSQIPKRTNPV